MSSLRSPRPWPPCPTCGMSSSPPTRCTASASTRPGCTPAAGTTCSPSNATSRRCAKPWFGRPGPAHPGSSSGTMPTPRAESRSVQVIDLESGPTHRLFPHAARAIKVVRRRRRRGHRPSIETVYAITSLTHRQAEPGLLAAWIRSHWCIENRLHWIRDVTLGEDHSSIRTAPDRRSWPRSATLRSTSPGWPATPTSPPPNDTLPTNPPPSIGSSPPHDHQRWMGSSDLPFTTLQEPCPPWGPPSEVALEELGAPQDEGPVLAGVRGDGDDEVAGSQAGGLLQPSRQPGVERPLLGLRAPLLEDLQDDEVVGALDAQAGVLADELSRVVFGDHLVPVPGGCGEHVKHHLLDGVGQATELVRGAPTLDDVDADERHGGPSGGVSRITSLCQDIKTWPRGEVQSLDDDRGAGRQPPRPAARLDRPPVAGVPTARDRSAHRCFRADRRPRLRAGPPPREPHHRVRDGTPGGDRELPAADHAAKHAHLRRRGGHPRRPAGGSSGWRLNEPASR